MADEEQIVCPTCEGTGSCPPCWFCGKPATLLCDFCLGRDLDKIISKEVMHAEDKSFTCDASMCNDCATQIGHVCGRPKYHDTIDMCPIHKDIPGVGDMRRAIRGSDADAYRNRMRMALKNGKVPIHEELRC